MACTSAVPSATSERARNTPSPHAAAEAVGHRESLVAALRELAYADVQAGRRAAVERRLARADRLANSDTEHAAIFGVQGMNRSDMGDYPGAFAALHRSVELAERCGDRRQLAFSLSLIARARLLRDEPAEARQALDRALELTESERWLAFLPFPETMRGEVDLSCGEVAAAGERIEHAFAIACDLQDPCWEGLTARDLALLHHACGEPQAARRWIEEARTRCTRMPDRYVWMHGHLLETAIDLAIQAGDRSQAGTLLRVLSAMAARAEMRELVVRGLVHAARLGQAGAVASARVLGREIDNPALAKLFGEVS